MQYKNPFKISKMPRSGKIPRPITFKTHQSNQFKIPKSPRQAFGIPKLPSVMKNDLIGKVVKL